MIERGTICGFLVSAAFHAAAVGLLAWGTLGPPQEEAPPMLVVSQWASHEPIESFEFEVPLPPSQMQEFPVVAPPSAEPVAVALGDVTQPMYRDLSGSSDQPALSFGLSTGTLSGSAGSAGGEGYAATFFGTRVVGNRFVYVVDASRSMAGSRFRKAKRELFRSISNLRPNQQYYVVFFGLDSYPMYFPEPQADLVASEPKTWKRLHRWMGYVDPRTQPATNGKSAMLLAISLEPDAVYLLSDGVFTDDTVPALLAMNETPTPIHTIAFGTEAARADLERIAHKHNGTYRFTR